MLKDIHFGVRQLWRNPGFTSITVLTLALGIGATSSVFSLIHGVLLTPPPYSCPQRIVLIKPVRLDGRAYADGCAAAQWTEWQKEAKSFEAMAGYHWEFDFLCLPGSSEPVCGLVTTPSYFQVVGVKPLLGRPFLASEGYKDPVVILGYDLWRSRFNGDAHIIGKSIHLSRSDWNDIGPRTVVGVMPAALRFLPSPTNAQYPDYDVNARINYWIPAQVDSANPKHDYYNVVARLHQNTTPAQAQVELSAIAARQGQADFGFEGLSARVEPLKTELNREGRRLLLPLFGAVTLVFLIACGNAAGLLLSRGLQRKQEYAVCRALGAGRSQLLRQVLAESLLLSILSGVLGVGLAAGTVIVLKLFAGAAVPRLDAVTIGWPVLGFCFGVSLIAAILAGFVPAFRASQVDPANGLKNGGRTSSASRTDRQLLNGLAVVQTAFTLALLVGAGLLIRTVTNLAHLHPGYDTQNILTMSITQVRYAQTAGGLNDGKDWAQRFLDFHHRALAQVAALSGVKNVSWAWGVPLTGNKWVGSATIDGQLMTAGGKNEIRVPMRAVTPEYFETVSLPIIAGRNFRSKEAFDWPWPPGATNAPMAAMINQIMAERYFPGLSPVGKTIRFSFENVRASAEIVGVAANSRSEALTQKAEPEMYFSFWQLPPGTKHLVVRSTSDPAPLAATIQAELRRLDPTVVIQDLKTFEQIRNDSMASQLFAMRLLASFSFLAVTVAVIGIYGVLSLSVGSRRREIAVRIAVGAQRRNILGLILGQGFKLIFVGVAIGTGLALASTGILKAFLFGVEPTDVITFFGVASLFVVVALVACYIPARRAARTDPMMALRYE
jgi:putative ABC transport system permease protein